MGNLITLNNVEEDEVLNKLFSTELIIIEDVQGSKIWLNWDGEKFNIKPKSLNNDPINLVDLAMQNYYNQAVNYFNSLDNRVKSLLNKKWWFCFEYFPDTQPAHIDYDRVPKNNLVLTSVNKNKKYVFNYEEVIEFARLFNVDSIPVIYQGILTETMKEAIKYFINTSEKDLEYIFGERSFSYFFFKILNPNLTESFLMDGDFQNNMEKIIIRTIDGDISFELLNPLYKKMDKDNNTTFVETYTLILINFLNFCQSINIEEIKIKGNNKEECYLYLISNIFNIYMNSVKDDLMDFEFTIPQFFDKDKFKINKELIDNKLTKEFIDISPKLEYIFKVILGSFNKKKKKAIGIFTESTVTLFNNYVDDINKHIERHLNKLHEIELSRNGLLDFSDFFDIKYDADAEGQIYPDVYSEFEKGKSSDKKDKKDKGGYYKK